MISITRSSWKWKLLLSNYQTNGLLPLQDFRLSGKCLGKAVSLKNAITWRLTASVLKARKKWWHPFVIYRSALSGQNCVWGYPWDVGPSWFLQTGSWHNKEHSIRGNTPSADGWYWIDPGGYSGSKYYNVKGTSVWSPLPWITARCRWT